MNYSLHLTQNWPFEKINSYRLEITSAFKKLEKRFPNDVSIEQIAQNLLQGKQQLWLILDDNQEFIAFAITEIEIMQNQKKRMLLLEVAGKGGQDLAKLIPSLEEFALTMGVTELLPIGRIGWHKALAKQGYYPEIIRYRKEL